MSEGFSRRSLGESWKGKEPAFSSLRKNRSQAPSRFSAVVAAGLRVPGQVFRWLKAKKEELGWKKFLTRGALWAVGLFAAYVALLLLTLPNINDPTQLRADLSTVIVDRNGTELYRLFNEEDRTIVPAEGIPDNMRHAIVAIEDERFYTRGCLDVRALLRAMLSFGHSGGASTLTRQLARNALGLQRQNVISRKLKELILGCQLETKYSKDDLLNMYLNWIPFGQNAYGVEQASKRFFGKSAKDLSIAEAAVLASLPQSPTYYSPYGKHIHTTVTDKVIADIVSGKIKTNNDIRDEDFQIGLLGAKVGTGKTLVYIGGRTDQVLRNMRLQKYITEEEETKALADLQKIEFKKYRENIRAAHFVLWVRDQVEQLLGSADQKGILEQGGLTIQTTLDWNLQQEAEKAVAKYKDTASKVYEAHNIALVSMDPKTREILAYVGNTDYADEVDDGKVDMAQAPRQPGSSFKPFSYAAAFLQGYSPATPLYDVQTTFGQDIPSNFDGGYWGLVTARQALAGSRNIPAIKAFFLGGGEDAVLDIAAKMGVPTPRNARAKARETNKDYGYGWPLAIGAAEAPLVEMVSGYASFANQGIAKPVVSIKKITTNKGAILYQSEDKQDDEVQAIDPRVAYQITSILSDVSARPTEFWQQALTVPGTQAAAKTGTSNKCLDKDGERKSGDSAVCKKRRPSDLWTMGYTPVLATGVWVGNAKSTPLAEKAESLSIAAPIWKAYMTAAVRVMKPTVTTFAAPDGIVQPQISLLSGELPTDCTPVSARSADVFLREHAPSLEDPACVKLLVDKVTGLLASDACPVDAQEEQSFLVPTSVAAMRWPLWEQGVQAWAKKMRALGSGALMSTSGSLKIPLRIAPDTKCDPSLTPGRLVKPTLSITYPQTGDAVPYPAFRPKLSMSVGSTVRELVYTIDGKDIAHENARDIRTPIRVPRSISKDGTHTLTVTLVDQYYNKATAEVSFRFGEDTGAPDVQVIAPAGGTSFKTTDTLTIQANASDREGEVRYVEFYLDETLLSRGAREPYSVSYPLKDIAPGTHTVRAVATDASGKTGEDAVTITIQ